MDSDTIEKINFLQRAEEIIAFGRAGYEHYRYMVGL